MNAQREKSNVNSDEAVLTCKHRFSDGQTATFKLWRNRHTITWEPPLPELTDDIVKEFYIWYGDVLGKILEIYQSSRTVQKSVISTENGYVTGWCVTFSDGLCVDVTTPHELFYWVSATLNGEDVSHRVNARFFAKMVQDFVFGGIWQ